MHDVWTARPAADVGDRRVTAMLLALALTLALLPLAPAPAGATTGTISGVAFQDMNRDGVHQPDEPIWEDHLLYLFDGSGNYLKNARTDAQGRYAFDGVGDGEYTVVLASTSWTEIRDDWVPTTTGSLRPQVRVSLDGSATADFGWRPIVRSTDVAEPITSLTGPSGIRIASYNDVITAEQIHDALLGGSLIGPEAQHTRIRHDLSGSTACSIAVGRSGGQYTSYSAACHISWNAWLTTPHRSLFHEYGHAWSMYHAFITHRDADLTDYLEFRGLLGDDRLDSSHEWSRYEIIAEDYRQLFGSPSGRAAPQENRHIPTADDVPGLREFLSGAFVTDPGSDTDDEPDPEPEPEPDPASDPEPDDDGDDELVAAAQESLARFVSPTSGETVSGTIGVRLATNIEDPASVKVVFELGGSRVTSRYHRGSGHHIGKVDSTVVADGDAVLAALVTHPDGSVEVAEVEVVVANSGGGGGGNGKGHGKGGKK